MANKDEDLVRWWLAEIERANKDEEKWRKESEEYVKIYEAEDAKKNSFNILYSNTETLLPAIYSRTPNPDVRRRYMDKDDIGKQVAELAQRAASYCLDVYDFDAEIRDTAYDYLLTGRGVTRIEYEPYMEGETINYAEVTARSWDWEDFRMQPCKRWRDCGWIAFKHYMDRDDLREVNPEVADNVQLDWSPKNKDTENPEQHNRAIVWEIWDKRTRTRLYIATGYKDKPLANDEDPLKLEKFFPMPKPIYSITNRKDMVPIPEYRIYREQAEELNDVSARIAKLTKALKLRGIYDASIQGMAALLEAGDNEMVPVEEYASLLSQGGIEKAFAFMPIEDISKVLAQLYLNREQIKQTIYEITGVSDIVRGNTEASETATAQQIKSQWGTLRLDSRQKAIQAHVRDLIRLKIEIMGEHFDPQLLSLMTGLEVTQKMVEVVSTDGIRGFRIDIETDSTIATDKAAEQEAVTTLLGGLVEFLNGMAPLVQAGGMPMEVVKSLALLAIRPFKGAREVEDAINSIQDDEGNAQVQQLNQVIQQLQQELESKKAEEEQKAQVEREKMQADMAKEQSKQSAEVAKLDFEREQAELDRQSKERIEEMKIMAANENARLDRELQLEIARMGQRSKEREE